MAIQNGYTINQFFSPIESNKLDNNKLNNNKLDNNRSNNNEIENIDFNTSSIESKIEIELKELIYLIEIKLQDKILVLE